MNIHEWTLHYIKARYLNLKLIEQTNNISFVYNTSKYDVRIFEKLPEKPPEQIDHVQQIIATLNTKKNVQTLIQHFQQFAQHNKLIIIFVNPKTNEKWLLNPHTHNFIADKASLKRGILSLFETVPPV